MTARTETPSTRTPAGVALTFVALLTLGACDGTPGSSGADLGPAEPTARPDDGLLERPDLQAVVDFQVARDAAGLREALSSADPAVRARAAYGLASVQDTTAVAALVPLLADPDASVRRDAAFALGQTGQASIIDPVLEALGDESDVAVRGRLLEALGKLSDPSGAVALLSVAAAGPRDEAARSLALARLMAVQGVRHQPAQDHLLDRLDDGNADVRWAAAYYFGRQPEPGTWVPRISRVRQALDGYDAGDPAAMHLVQALGRIGDPVDTDRLVAMAASSPDWRTRFNALVALTEREVEPVVETFLAALDDPAVHVAAAGAERLAMREHPPSRLAAIRAWAAAHPDRLAVVAPLVRVLARQDEREFVFAWIDATDPDDGARMAAGAGALALMRGQEATARLARAAASPSTEAARPAVGGLAQRWARDRRDPATHQAYFEVFRDAALRGDPGLSLLAAPVLADSLFGPLGNVVTLSAAYDSAVAHDEPEAMVPVLTALAATGVRAAEGVLRRGLVYPNERVRAAAANGLGVLTGQEPTPEAVPPGATVAGSDSAADAGDDAPVDAANAPADPGRIDWDFLQSVGSAPRLILETEAGRVVVRLATADAPHTVQTIVRMADAGLYADVPFHRVVPNFVTQGGDFTRRDGTGGPGYAITSEFTLIPFERGVIGMASAGKDTEGSQFFINHVATPHLDGRYTAFGTVVEGMDVVDALVPGDLLLSARVERGG